MGDFGGGALYLALGVTAALLEARTSGQGQVVDAAMVDGASNGPVLRSRAIVSLEEIVYVSKGRDSA